MKLYIITLIIVQLFIARSSTVIAQNVAINANGTAPNASAMLDVQSTTKGMLIPRMSTIERTAIAAPATGLLVFDNTTGSFWFKRASGWAELIDSTNTIWTKKDANVYLNNGESVGIGTNNPATRLQISNGTDIANNTGGFLQLGLSSNPNLALDNNELQARNNGATSDLYMQVAGGNVGIGTNSPQVKLEVNGGTDVSLPGGGFLQLGSFSSSNLAFDNNEIQARDGGTPSALYLQNSGGSLQIGSASGNITDVHINNGQLLQAKTGNANMMPLCYGHVSANGTLLGGTSNVSITKGQNTAQYFIICSGITSSTMMIAVSNKITDPAKISVAYSSAGQAKVTIENFNTVDGEFSFIFYNP